MTVREPHTESRLAPPRPASLPHEVMALLPDHWPAELPLARVTTCGPSVSITVLHQLTPTPVYGPPDPVVLAGGYASTALLLLAVLASRQHCAASKDWLSEALITRRSVLANKDDPEERVPLQRVENPVSVLRHLLVPPVLRALPTLAKLRLHLVSFYRSTRESGCGYRLAGMPLIWVDVVAIEESITRAHALEQFGSDAQREWEAAYTLLMQGEFAEHAPYSDWALWRRQEQERQRWECVQALQGYYRKQGEPGEREATRLLQRYWQNHMSNEDAFRPLVELLGKQEGFGQAEEAYTHLTQALEEEGKEPDRRTQEVMTWLRALQIQRTPSRQQSISPEKEPKGLSIPLSQAIKDKSSQEVDHDACLQEPNQKETTSAMQTQPFSSSNQSLTIGTCVSVEQPGQKIYDPLSRLLPQISQTKNSVDLSLHKRNIRVALHLHRVNSAQSILQNLNAIIRNLEYLEQQTGNSSLYDVKELLIGSDLIATKIVKDQRQYEHAYIYANNAVRVAKNLEDGELLATTKYVRGCVQLEWAQFGNVEQAMLQLDKEKVKDAMRDFQDVLTLASTRYISLHAQLCGFTMLQLSRAQSLLIHENQDTVNLNHLELMDQAGEMVGHDLIDDAYTRLLMTGTLSGLHRGGYLLTRADILTVSGFPGQALTELNRFRDLTEETYTSDETRNYAWSDIVTAKALFGLKEYAEATHHALNALMACSPIHSTQNIVIIADIHRQLAASSYKNSQDVQELDNLLQQGYGS